MDSLQLLEELENIIEKGVSVPFTGRCLLDKDELLDFIEDLKIKLPDDLKQAKWIKEERQRILEEAQTEADDIIKAAKEKGISMIDENEITKKAMERSNKILEEARENAKTVQISSYTYADNLLENVERAVGNAMRDLEQCAKIVHENRNELK